MNPVVQMLLGRVGGAILDNILRGPDHHAAREERLKRDMEALERLERQLPATRPAPSSTASRGGTANPRLETAGTQETIAWQRRELAKELYRLQMNLAAGGMINGKPCDCLSGKHALGLEALAEETMAMHQDPIYLEIAGWTKELDAKGTPEAIASGKYKEDYQRMAHEARGFRKRLLGTVDTPAALTGEERERVLKRAQAMARERLDALVEKELEAEHGSDRRRD